jgi:penicillin amidase
VRAAGAARRGWLLAVLLVLGAVAATVWVAGRLTGSLAATDGRRDLPGLSAPVRVERDAWGVPNLVGASRVDVARATGFVHAQERFFQMDLQRRRAAGELAALVGAPGLPLDREARVHRFRARAVGLLGQAQPAERALVDAYAEGVNVGLAALAAPPFEYLLLRRAPEPWRAEDSALVVYAMFLLLQGEQITAERQRGVLHDTTPEPLYRFLVPLGDGWDAPLRGEPLPVAPVPAPDVVDLRRAAPPAESAHAPARRAPAELARGSNNWAVSGARTRSGAALVANDMHLPWSVPNIWYRAALTWREAGAARRVAGVTLPGAPYVIVGSNGRVAWSFTNTQGDWVDLVQLEPVPGDPGAYLTPDGPRAFDRRTELLEVAGGDAERLSVLETIWGPVTHLDHRGRRVVTRWTAHDAFGVDLGIGALEAADTAVAALDVAARAGVPPQNFVAGDAAGHIGWTVIGAIPERFGHDGELPSSWADGSRGWRGRLDPAAYPRLVDPPDGILWTANQRTVDGADLARLGFGDWVGGARAAQIRDALAGLEGATERDMLAVQLDNRAVFLARWHALLLGLLTDAAVAADPNRAALRALLRRWEGRAAVDAAAYRAVRSFRERARAELFLPLTAAARAADPTFEYLETGLQQEGPLWRLVSERPPHLLDPRYASWEARLLALADATLAERLADGRNLAAQGWGDANRLSMRHPLSRALPGLAPWIDMPADPLGGDFHMPNAQLAETGSSERMAVSPGREAEGILHMPGGQSGHPLSPWYAAGHRAWLRGEPLPFLPGPAEHVLELVPAR